MSTSTNKYDTLFSEVSPMKDADIKKESSTLSESNRGAKGSSELLKNHHRATKGTTNKFITLQALTSSVTTSDTEEEGVVTTSDVSVVFQQCGEATKELVAIVTQYDYTKAVEIPEILDESKPASSGRWGTKTLNLLKNPTSVSLDTIKKYVSDTMQFTPADAPSRQTQVWMLETIRASVSSDLKTLVDSKFDILPVAQQGGSVYLKMLFDIIYNMTEPVVRALHKWIKNFRHNGLLKVKGENVLVLSQTAKNICQRLSEVNSLPTDAATDILEGLVKASHVDFSKTFSHLLTLSNQTILSFGSLKNKTVMEKITLFLTEAEDLYIVYTVNGTWKYKHATSYYTGERVDLICFNCGKVGHSVRDCKEPRDQARIDKSVAQFREKKNSGGAFRNNGSGGRGSGGYQGGRGNGGYQRKSFNKPKEGESARYSNKEPNKKKKDKKADDKKTDKPGEATPTFGLAQLGDHFSKMVTTTTDPNQASMAQMFADLCQGKV